jgi:hypothetical protein
MASVLACAVIGKLLFLSDLPDWLRQLQTYSIFAVGYLARAIGGIVMAHFGNLYGPAFSLTSIKVPSYTPCLTVRRSCRDRYDMPVSDQHSCQLGTSDQCAH